MFCVRRPVMSHRGPDDGAVRVQRLVDPDFMSRVVMNLAVHVAVKIGLPGFLTHHTAELWPITHGEQKALRSIFTPSSYWQQHTFTHNSCKYALNLLTVILPFFCFCFLLCFCHDFFVSARACDSLHYLICALIQCQNKKKNAACFKRNAKLLIKM